MCESVGTAERLSEKFNCVHRGKSEALEGVVAELYVVCFKVVRGVVSVDADDRFWS